MDFHDFTPWSCTSLLDLQPINITCASRKKLLRMHIIKIWPWPGHNIWSGFITRQLPAIQRINNSIGSCLPAFFLFLQCLLFPAKIVYGHNSTYVGWLLMPKYTWKVIEIHTVKCKYNVFNTFVDIAQCLMIFFLFLWMFQVDPAIVTQIVVPVLVFVFMWNSGACYLFERMGISLESK